MGEATVAGIGLDDEDVLLGRIVQGVVEPGDHAGGVAERRMGRHVRDALPVDVDLASIPEALQILLTRKRLGRNNLRPIPPPRPEYSASSSTFPAGLSVKYRDSQTTCARGRFRYAEREAELLSRNGRDEDLSNELSAQRNLLRVTEWSETELLRKRSPVGGGR